MNPQRRVGSRKRRGRSDDSFRGTESLWRKGQIRNGSK